MLHYHAGIHCSLCKVHMSSSGKLILMLCLSQLLDRRLIALACPCSFILVDFDHSRLSGVDKVKEASLFGGLLFCCLSSVSFGQQSQCIDNFTAL